MPTIDIDALHPCPFCGARPIAISPHYVGCINSECPLNDRMMTVEDWNRRDWPRRVEAKLHELWGETRTVTKDELPLVEVLSKFLQWLENEASNG